MAKSGVRSLNVGSSPAPGSRDVVKSRIRGVQLRVHGCVFGADLN